VLRRPIESTAYIKHWMRNVNRKGHCLRGLRGREGRRLKIEDQLEEIMSWVSVLPHMP
jgi:hypothetical protein